MSGDNTVQSPSILTPDSSPPVIYISGPMTGIPERNFPAFFEAEEILAGLGYAVVNPARITVADVKKPTWAQYMRADIAAMMRCDGVVTLEGWEQSKGAALEVYVAASLGMWIMDFEDVRRRPGSREDAEALRVEILTEGNGNG